MVNSPTSFKQYFEKLVPPGTGSLKSLKSFYYGDTFRIIEGTKDDTEYPCLWCETPDAGEEDTVTDFNGAINVVYSCEKGDEEAQDNAVNNAFEICTDIISRLEKDSKGAGKLFDFSKKTAKRYVIANWSSDNCYGIRMEFVLRNHLDYCYKPEKWN